MISSGHTYDLHTAYIINQMAGDAIPSFCSKAAMIYRNRWTRGIVCLFLGISFMLVATIRWKTSPAHEYCQPCLSSPRCSGGLFQLLNNSNLQQDPLTNMVRWNQTNNGTCRKKKRIAFIKVHKAASTTVTSIIQRFGLFHNLTFALPKKNLFHIGLFGPFHPVNAWPIRQGAVYEILCQHVVYNRAAFRKYLPPDITVIAAVREPFQRFTSAFLYFPQYSQSVKAKANVTGDISSIMRTFLQDPVTFEPGAFKKGSLVMSRMSFDLGLPKEQNNNRSYVEDYLKLLDEDMALVLVAEKFDESLVMLKRMMCWKMKDILYEIRHKGRTNKPSIQDDVRKRYQELVPSEYQIYEHFRKKLEKLLFDQREDFSEEVEVFKTILIRVSHHCRNTKDKVRSILYINSSKFEEGFTFDTEDCRYLMLPEPSFVKHLINLQVPVKKLEIAPGEHG